MKVKKIILRDEADEQFDDLITFDEPQLLEDIYSMINYVRQNIDEYSNEDIYIALKQLGSYSIEYIGQYPIVKY